MKFAEKFLNMMTLNDSDDVVEEYGEEYDDMQEEYDDEELEAEEEPAEQPRKPVLSFRRKKQEVEEPEEPEEEPEARVIPIYANKEEGEVVKVINPKEFEESQIIAEFLKEGTTVIINLEGLDVSEAQRVIDFVGGASFAVSGSLKAISGNIFIVAPQNTDVSGDLKEEVLNGNMLSPELSVF